MYKITRVEHLVDKDWLMDVEAPFVARKAEPGQFMIAKLGELGERIPLTIADYDREKGTITIVFQVIGASTEKFSHLKEGDFFTDIVGPLGRPSELVEMSKEELEKENIIFIAGGVGAAPVYPQVKWLHERGIEADVILGAFSEQEIKTLSLWKRNSVPLQRTSMLRQMTVLMEQRASLPMY